MEIKTITYKNIQNLIKESKNDQITFSEYLEGKFYHKKFGWTKFKLKNDFDFKSHLSKLFGYIRPDQILNKEFIEDFGILRRIIIKPKTISYITAQCWSSETRTIRKLLKTRK